MSCPVPGTIYCGSAEKCQSIGMGRISGVTRTCVQVSGQGWGNANNIKDGVKYK